MSVLYPRLDSWDELRSHLLSHGTSTTTDTIYVLLAWNMECLSFHNILQAMFSSPILLIREPSLALLS